ncbi:MAG: CinA family protein [Acidimicrobiales bacterium]
MDEELQQLAARAAALLVARGETVAVCESAAGGLVSASLLSVPGASAYYLGGTVVYTLAASKALLAGVVQPPEGLRGATEDFARYQAQAIRGRLGAVWGTGETGATGPTPNRYGDPNGHAWVAVEGPVSRARKVATGSSDRPANMVAFASAALEELIAALESAG